jgi:hypothetical protein
MNSDDLERGTGASSEARQATMSDWFFRIGSTVMTGLDTQLKQAPIIANGGLSYGVGPNGEIYVQGSSVASQGQNASAASTAPKLSPLVLLALAAVAVYLLKKKG